MRKYALFLFLFLLFICPSAFTDPQHPKVEDTGIVSGHDFKIKGPWKDVTLYGSFANAISRLGDTNCTLLIPTKQIVSSHVIVPPNINLLFTKHGSLSINDGISVAINGSLKAELQPIFTGEGTVKFGRRASEYIYPEWWGAKPDGSMLNTTFIQKAINSISEYGGIIFFSSGTYIHGNLTCYSNITFAGGGWGSILRPQDGTGGFYISNLSGIIFQNLKFDCTGQTLRGSGVITNKSGSFVADLLIDHCEFSGGVYGAYLRDVSRGIIENCTAYNFTQWPFFVEGCNGFKYLRNTSYNNTYDGLKIAGVAAPAGKKLFKDILVMENICYGNGRDGFDIAGNNIENVVICNNNFSRNTFYGIDVKTAYQSDYFKNIDIFNNIIDLSNDGNSRGIHIETVIMGLAAEKVSIHGNTITHRNATIASINGIRVESANGSLIYDNTVIGTRVGILILDSNGVKVANNSVKNSNIGIQIGISSRTAQNNLVENNIISSVSSSILINHPLTTGTIVRYNKYSCSSDVDRLRDGGTGTIAFHNEVGYSATIPRVKATKGEIWWNSDPNNQEIKGWICTKSGNPGTFEVFRNRRD